MPGQAILGSNSNRQEHAMLDIIVLGLGAVFFVATIAYAYLCDRF
jgi:K+-transporting ATPase KdpF subunit